MTDLKQRVIEHGAKLANRMQFDCAPMICAKEDHYLKAWADTMELLWPLVEAGINIYEIGKRNMSNPKYDGYFDTSKEELAELEKNLAE